MERIKITFSEPVLIPERLRAYFWDDYPGPGYTFLEKFILRILIYGSTDEIKDVVLEHPAEAREILLKYHDQIPVYRGLKKYMDSLFQ